MFPIAKSREDVIIVLLAFKRQQIGKAIECEDDIMVEVGVGLEEINFPFAA